MGDPGAAEKPDLAAHTLKNPASKRAVVASIPGVPEKIKKHKTSAGPESHMKVQQAVAVVSVDSNSVVEGGVIEDVVGNNAMARTETNEGGKEDDEDDGNHDNGKNEDGVKAKGQKKWTPKQEEALHAAVNLHGTCWVKIKADSKNACCRALNDRTVDQMRKKWERL